MWTRTFPREVPEVPRARHFVHDLLEQQGLAATDEILLVTSEFVTNAVRHGAGTVELRVDASPTCVRVEVVDGGHATLRAPAVPPPADAIGGRGLHLVRSVSDRWGAGFDEDGRTLVWAELPAERASVLV